MYAMKLSHRGLAARAVKQLAAVVVTGLSMVAVPAFAQPPAANPAASKTTAVESNSKTSHWDISLGAASLWAMEYEGGEHTQPRGFPLINVLYKNRFFLAGRSGLGVNVLKNDELTVSLGLGYSAGRDESDSPALSGLGDVDSGLSLKARVSKRIKFVQASLSLEQQLTGDVDGLLLTASLGTRLPLPGGVFAQPYLSATYADQNYMDAYFTITPTQSANSGLASYRADAGLKSTSAGLMLSKQLGEHWRLFNRFAFSRIQNSAADSPVVQTRNQPVNMAGLSYHF